MTHAISARGRHARIFDLLCHENLQTARAQRHALSHGRTLDGATAAQFLKACHESLLGSEQARAREPDMYRRPRVAARPETPPDRDLLQTHALLALI